MALPLNEEQLQLRDTMRGWFSDNYSLQSVRAVFDGKRLPIQLSDLAALGLKEAFTFDKSGWGYRELAIVAFEAGYALAPCSLYLVLLATTSPLQIPFDNGRHAVQFTSQGQASCDAQQERIDRTQHFAVVDLAVTSGSQVAPSSSTPGAVCLLANEAAGICAKVIELTKDYVTTRKQFSKPIGSFQAVQHKLAQLFLAAEALRTTAEFCAWAGSHSPEQFDFSAAAARTLASETVEQVVEGCIQLHGGIGFTWEHDLHLYLRRAKLLSIVLKPDVESTNILLTGR